LAADAHVLAGDYRGDVNGTAVTTHTHPPHTDNPDREAEAREPPKYRKLAEAESEAEQQHAAASQASKMGSSKAQSSEAQRSTDAQSSVRGQPGESLVQVQAGETRVEGGARVVRVGAVVLLDPSLLPGHAPQLPYALRPSCPCPTPY
jgi:hypothetical protein